jgi:aminoglycoside phosphotransferase (APT) family kinase protein
LTESRSDARPQTSTRDLGAVTQRLAEWLRSQLAADGAVTIRDAQGPASAGFSSETLLFEASWLADGTPRRERLVLRLPPPDDAFPLFPRYEMQRQVHALRLVHARSTVPVPEVLWSEPRGAALGAPFYVMEQVDGAVVPDMPPYVFGSWVTQATTEERDRMRSGAVDVLVGIHGIDVDADELAVLALDAPGETALARHVANQRRYYDWIRAGTRFPVIEDAFAWLEGHWPADDESVVVSWGDARLANILWREFEPVAVLDWEAAAVGPAELDVGWMVFFHEYFERIAQRHGAPGCADLLDRRAVVTDYQARSGRVLRDMDWYLVYAELRQALTSIRVSERAVAFGERERPDDPQDLILERGHLEGVITGDVGI